MVVNSSTSISKHQKIQVNSYLPIYEFSMFRIKLKWVHLQSTTISTLSALSTKYLE